MSDQRQPTIPAFDHHSAEVAADPVGVYADIREKCPAFWTETYGGYWVFSRYEDLRTILGDNKHFSSARRSDAGGEGSSVSIPKRPSVVQYPIELDPPEHTPYRLLLNPLLSPSACEKLRDPIAQRVDWFIDRFVERGEVDLVRELASPVPASVTIDWLGLPHDEWQRMATTMHHIIARGPEDPERIQAGKNLSEIYGVVRQVIAERREQSSNDVISYILGRSVNGHPVNDDEALSMIALLIVGGVGTTTSLTAQTLVWLSENRADHQRLLEDSHFLQVATEEFLRYFTPVQSQARTTSGEAAVAGCPMHDGDRVLLAFGSANRDPAAFESPDTLIIDRFPNRHLAFSVGVHRCVGSNLARVMFQEMIKGVLRRIPDFSVDGSLLQRYPSQGLNSGWQTVPATFTPSISTGTELANGSLALSR